MKRVVLLTSIFLQSLLSHSQSVAVNTDGTPADTSAMLDVKSSIKGILIPRMSTAERQAIITPATGLLVFDNDVLTFWFFNGANWIEIGSGGVGGSWVVNGANIYNSNGGNVGIGTMDPVTLLTLKTPINTAGWTHIGGADSIIISEGIGGVSGSIGTSTFHAFRLNAGGFGRMHLYPAGEVVVGSNATGSFGKFTVETTNNTYGISHLGEGGNVLATRMGGTSAGIGTFSPTNMRLFSGGNSCIFIAEATGNVGIGTDNPTYKLSVNGNVRSKEVVVETGWADYVFTKSYKLPSLWDVEKFIRRNGHLPNIPSAKEVEEKGLLLGDTQKKMMEKIEELTLYVIEAAKKIERLEKLVADKN
jgi:hypothetical protein